MAYDYDILILGGGIGGYESAIWAANHDRKVGIIERDVIGGTCLNRGCIPTKTLLHGSKLYDTMAGHNSYGITAENVNFHYDVMIEHKDKLVEELRNGVELLLERKKIDVIYGEGKLIEEHTIIVSERRITSEYIILATGAKTVIPKIRGYSLKNVHISDTIMHEKKFYQSIVIVGGGIIGIEYATIYSELGCKVTILEAKDRILSAFDKEISTTVATTLKKKGVTILTKVNVLEISYLEPESKELLVVSYEEIGYKELGNKELSYKIAGEGVLLAIGRYPCVEGLGLGDVGIRLVNGKIDVNATNQTNLPHIYAIGDLVCSIQLAHVAAAEGINAVDNILGKVETIDTSIIPMCIYTHPEVAVVGITKEEAKRRGYDVSISKYPLTSNSKVKIEEDSRSYIKIISQNNTNVILGGEIVCQRATDMIGELALAIQNKMECNQYLKTMRAHPTYYESSNEAILNILNLGIHGLIK